MSILIATVGTSLLGNVKKENKEIKMEADKIIQYIKSKQSDDRICGAEINSAFSLINKNIINPDIFYLMTSDTKEGILSGEIVKKYFETTLGFKKGELIKIEGLNSEKPKEFEKKGLRNLVSEISKIISKTNISDVIMAPIGGFKAQIFMTGLIGQVFGIKTYYMFESFDEVIEILPLPISFDYEYFSRNIDFFDIMNSREELIEEKEIKSFLEKEKTLRNLIKIEEIENKKYVEFSAIGELFYQKFALETKNYLPKSTGKLKNAETDIQSASNEGHLNTSFNDGKFKKFLEKVLNIDYVEKIIINYYLPDNKGNQIRIIKGTNQRDGRVIRFEFNHNNGLVGGNIFTTAKDEKEIEAAIVDIREKISNY